MTAAELVLYKTNERFADYVDKYCKKHNLTIEDALSHRLVKEYAQYLKENDLWKRTDKAKIHIVTACDADEN